MQGTWVWYLLQEDFTGCGTTRPVYHNCWPGAPEPRNHTSWTHVLQLLKPAHLKPVLRKKRRHCSEKPLHRNEEQSPLTAAREKPAEQQRHSTVKNKENDFLKKPISGKTQSGSGAPTLSQAGEFSWQAELPSLQSRWCTGCGAWGRQTCRLSSTSFHGLHTVQLSSVIWLSHR